MADILMLLPNITVANPGHPGAWLPLSPVDVFPDGQLGPGSQQHPRFFVVRIPGVSVDDVNDLIAEVLDLTDPNNPVMIKRRDYSLVWNRLPQQVKNSIENDRDITVNHSLFRTYLDKTVTEEAGAPAPTTVVEKVRSSAITVFTKPVEVVKRTTGKVTKRGWWVVAIAALLAALLGVLF